MTDPGFASRELEALGDALLHYANFTVAMIVAIALIVVYGIVHVLWRRDQSVALPIVLILHSVVTLYIAIASVSALTLPIAPPRADAFERNEWKLIGAYVFANGFFFFLYEVTRVFLRGGRPRERQP